METYDLIMLGVLVAATIFGIWKGMAWQIASLASLVISYFAALRFSAQLAPKISDQPWNRFAAMLLIYVVVSFVVWMIFRMVSDIIDKVRLESFDRQLGGVFGFAKGVLLCVAITFFAVTLLPPAQGQAIVNSRSGHYIVALLNKADSVFPPEVHQVVDPYLNKVEERLNPNFQPQGQDLRQLWQTQAQPQPGGPANYFPNGFPAQQPAVQWPSDAPQQGAPKRNPYGAPPTQNGYPNPQSASLPGTRDY